VVLRQGETTPEKLGALISELLGDKARLERMAAAMRGLGRPQAAEDIVGRLGGISKKRH